MCYNSACLGIYFSVFRSNFGCNMRVIIKLLNNDFDLSVITDYGYWLLILCYDTYWNIIQFINDTFSY
jgi:hypothetical protein